MRFFSDNAAPVHPAVMRALSEVDTLDTAYDGDRWSKQLDGRLSHLFETDVRAFWVPSGTAANCLALAALCPPYGAVLCHRDAHIENDEAGAPGFFTGGAKLILLGGAQRQQVIPHHPQAHRLVQFAAGADPVAALDGFAGQHPHQLRVVAGHVVGQHGNAQPGLGGVLLGDHAGAAKRHAG